MIEEVVIYSIAIGFIISVILSPIFIPFLRRLKFGQSIREEGPKSHQKNQEHLQWVVSLLWFPSYLLHY